MSHTHKYTTEGIPYSSRRSLLLLTLIRGHMSAPPVRNPFKIGLFAHLASQEQLRKLHIVVHVTWPSVTSRQRSGDAVIRYFAWGRSDMGSTRSHAWRTHTDGRGGRCSGAALRNVFYSRSTIWLLGGRYHPACLMNRRESVQQPEGKSAFHSTTSINNFRIFDIHLLSSICCSAVEGHVIDVSWDHGVGGSYWILWKSFAG